MLAPLTFFLTIWMIACAETLLTCWLFDHDDAEAETGISRPAALEFPVHLLEKRIPPVCATPTLAPAGRARSVVIHRSAAQLLSWKAHFQRLRKNGDKPFSATFRSAGSGVISCESRHGPGRCAAVQHGSDQEGNKDAASLRDTTRISTHGSPVLAASSFPSSTMTLGITCLPSSEAGGDRPE